MIAFHGCAVHHALALVTALETQHLHLKGPRFNATDTVERATRYANAQVTGTIDLSLTQELVTYDAVIHLEVPEREWWTQGEAYTGSLDTVERSFKITESRVVRVVVRPAAAHLNDSTHRDIAHLRALLGDRLVTLKA